MSPWVDRGLRWILATGLGMAAGCASGGGGRRVEAGGVVATVPTDPWAPLVLGLQRGEPGAVERWVRAAFEATDRGENPVPLLERACLGREVVFFETAFDAASHEARDVGPCLEALAAAVGRAGPAESRRAVVREVSGRECCMRRSFMAAALRGLASGIAEGGGGAVVDAESAIRLDELVEVRDEGLAAAARLARRWFTLPAR